MRSLLLDATREGASLLTYKHVGDHIHTKREPRSFRTCGVRSRVSGVVAGLVSPAHAVLQLEVPQTIGYSSSLPPISQPQRVQPAQQSHPVWTQLHHTNSSSSRDHSSSVHPNLKAAVGPAQQHQQQQACPDCQRSQQRVAELAADSGQQVDGNTAVDATSQSPQARQQQLQRQRWNLQHLQVPQSHGSSNSSIGCSSSSSSTYRRGYRLHLTRHLIFQAQLQLAAGKVTEAEQLLYKQILRIKSLPRLESAIDKLTTANLLRPAVVIALLSQLRKIVARQQQQQQWTQWQQQQLLARKLNRERQCRRRQYRLENQQRKEQEAAQQAEAAAAAQAQAAAEQQTIRQRLRGTNSSSSKSGRSKVQSSIAAADRAIGSSCVIKQQQQRPTRAAAAGKRQRRLHQPVPSRMSSRASAVVAASKSSSPARRQQHSSQQQHRAPPAAVQAAMNVIRLQQRLVTLVKAGLAGYSTVQLQLLQTCLMRLKVSDRQLWQRLGVLGLQQLPTTKPQKLVPLLVGAARAEAAAAAGCSSHGHARLRLSVGSSNSQKQQQERLHSVAAGSGDGVQRQEPHQPLQHHLKQSYCEEETETPAAVMQPSQCGRSSLQRPQHQQQRLRRNHHQQQRQQQQLVVSHAQQQLQLGTASNQPSADFVASWLEASASNLSLFSASQLASSIYSLALLKQQPPERWLSSFFAASLEKLQYCSSQDLSNMLWALATLQLQPPDSGWWSRFQVSVTAALWSFSGTGIANLIWACGKLRLQPNPQVSQLLLWQAQRRFNSMGLKLLVSMTWGVAELELKPQIKWFRYLTRRVTWLFRELTPGLAASLLLSLSSLHYCPKTWMKRFLAAVHPDLAAFSTQDIANTFTAFARMDYVPKDDWLFDFLLEARRAVPNCGTRELLAILNALSLLSNHTAYRVHPDFLAALLARARDCADGFSTKDCVNLAQSLVYLKVAPGVAVLAAVMERFSQGLAATAAEPGDVAGMLWALGAFWRSSSECLWLRQHPQLLQQLLVISQQQLAARLFAPLELKRVLAAVAAMACNPGADWLAAHEAAAVEQLQDLYPASVESLLRGYRMLGYQPQQLQQAVAQQEQLLQQQQQHEQQAAMGEQCFE